MASPDFNQLLKSKWGAIFSSEEAKDIFRSGFDGLKMKLLDTGYLAYFNASLIKNKRRSQVDYDTPEESKTNTDSKVKIFEDFDENKFNFNDCTPPEILFYVNLDEETVITKEANDKWEEEHLFDEEQLEHEISETENHPVVINVSPLCPNHCIIPLFPQEELPQTIGQDIIMLLLQVFKISNSKELKIGYNSLGAFASVNHLHFQLLYGGDLFKSAKFPIEEVPRKEIHRTSLQNPNEKINIYSVGVIIEELVNYPVRGFVLKPFEEKAELGDIYSSLSFVAGTITNYLLEKEIPHNLVFSDLGQTIYIIPRQHESNHQNEAFKCAWLEIAGLAVCRDEETYNIITPKTFEEVLTSQVSLSEKEFDDIKENSISIFKKNYE